MTENDMGVTLSQYAHFFVVNEHAAISVFLRFFCAVLTLFVCAVTHLNIITIPFPGNAGSADNSG